MQIEPPNFCVIEVSHKCMFQCKMCNYWKTDDDHGEITIKELCGFISSLKEFINVPFEMNISGGETLLKEGMLDLLDFVARQGIRFSLVTNGYLIDKLTAKRIANSGLTFLAISLDSVDGHTHDYLRGTKGARDRAMEALKYFNSYRGELKNIIIQTIIMGPNLDGIPELINWAHEMQFSLSFMAITRPNMIPVDDSWYKKKDFGFLWPEDPVKVLKAIDNIIELKKCGYKIDNPVGQLERFKRYFSDPEKFAREIPCNLGDKIIHINPKGNVYLCCEMEHVGNIKETGIAEIWVSEKAKNIREKIKVCKRNCTGMVNCYRETP